jgi:dCTP diphosphatase
MDTLEGLRLELRTFFEARDWRRFHAPKNIVMSLVSETAELMQHFRWMSEEASWQPAPEALAEIRDEVGDVLINLVALCDELGIDCLEAAQAKLRKIELRYPLAPETQT